MAESEGRFESVRQWMRQSSTFKFACVGVLVLLLLYPVALVRNLVAERQSARDTVVQDVSSKWGDTQRLTGPILTVPYEKRTSVGDDQIATQTLYAHFLPERLEVDGALSSETRSRSIYEVLLYRADLSFSGHFNHPDFSHLEVGEGTIRWDRAFVTLGITDSTGIRAPISMKLDGKGYQFEPGLQTQQVVSSGVSVPVDLSGDVPDGAGGGGDAAHSFDFDVRLNGRKRLDVVPVGKETDVHLEGDSGSPSFGGAHLPDDHTVETDRFAADWNVLDLNRSYPQRWLGDEYRLGGSAFGVELLTPVDHYRKAERSTKYGLLFIVLTFMVFLFGEVLNDNRIHPVQYLMVGAALCVFYILLLALSEHVGFNLAYLFASAGVIGSITGYSGSVLEDRTLTAIVGGALVALYGFLFTVLQLESYALLIGSLGLFGALAAAMYLSRNVDWYRKMSTDGSV